MAKNRRIVVKSIASERGLAIKLTYGEHAALTWIQGKA